MGRAKRIWYLSHMRAAKVQASLRIRAVSPEPPLLAHTSSESRGTFRQKARSLAPLNGWACAVKMCHDGMLEDTNSLVAAHFMCQHSDIRDTLSITTHRDIWPKLYFTKYMDETGDATYYIFFKHIMMQKVWCCLRCSSELNARHVLDFLIHR